MIAGEGTRGGKSVREKKRKGSREIVLQMFISKQDRPKAWHLVWKFAGSQQSLIIDTAGISHKPPTL